jgi:hypothetical protein
LGENVDARELDEEGLTICPECRKHYKPKLERPKGDDRPISIIFPDAKRYEREQLITGLCSNKCWRKHLGMIFKCPKDGKQCRTFSNPDCTPSRTCRHGDWKPCYSDLLCPVEQEMERTKPTYPPKRLRDWKHLQ